MTRVAASVGFVGCLAFVAATTTAGAGSADSQALRAAALVYPVDAYGGKCDGSTNDTSALVRAVAAADAAGGGTVVLPAGTCVIADTITIGTSGRGPYSHVALAGQGSDRTTIRYDGPMNRPALFANHESYVTWRDFSVSSRVAFGGHGSAVGILVGAKTGSGTQSTRLVFDSIAVSGFRYGLILGESAPSVSDASEFTCQWCRFSNNDVGATWSGYNTLNIQFIDSDTVGNTRGFEIGGDGTFATQVSAGPVIAGGSTAGNTEADFFIGNTFDVTTIRDVRAEPASYFIEGNTAFLEASGNTASPTRRADHVAVAIGASGGQVTLRNNALGGNIVSYTSGDGGWLEMRGNLVREGDPGRPVRLTRLSGSASGGRITLADNRWDGGPEALFPDVSGYLSSVDNVVSIVPVTSFDEPSAVDPNAGLHVTRLRSLAFGSSIVGQNLGGTVRFGGSGSAVFTFARHVAVTTRANNQTIAFPAGALTVADIGQAITIPGASHDCDKAGVVPANSLGTIASIVDGTHAIVTPSSTALASVPCMARITEAMTDAQATVGTDEPDANWYPVGLACTAPEMIYFDPSTLTAAGVTFKSSNPASRATCHFLVRR